jgi:hypothetical protein
MGMTVYTHGQSADNGNPGTGKLTGQHGTYPFPVTGGGTGTDDGNRWFLQTIGISPEVEDRRRIMDRAKKGRIAGIGEAEQVYISDADAFILLFRPQTGAVKQRLIGENRCQLPADSFYPGNSFSRCKHISRRYK